MGDLFRGFFGSNRGEPKEQSEKQLEMWLADAIEVHIRELRQIEYQRFEAFLQRSKAEQDTELRTLLDPMIQEFLRGQFMDAEESVARRRLPLFKPKQIPTYLTFANPNRVVELSPGESTNIVCLTDARDDVMAKARFELSISEPGILRATLTSHYAGRWIIRVSTYWDAPTNSTCELNACLSRTGAWIRATSKPLRIRIVVPQLVPLYVGSDPPTWCRIKTQGGEIRLQERKQRVIWIDTDCVDDLFTRLVNPAIFEITSMPTPIAYKGFNQPLRGQIGLIVSTLEGMAPLQPGSLEVKLKLADGNSFSDKAPVRIVPQPPRGGTITIESHLQVPNYEIVYVIEEATDNMKSWADMQTEFGQEWNKEDVAGYSIAPDAQGNDKLVIFINRDFADYAMEQKIWGRHGENWIKQMTKLYDAQVAFQCYQASIGKGDPQHGTDSSDSPEGYHFVTRDYKDYRGEMVRVGKTVLWARRQFKSPLEDNTVV